MTDKNNSQNPVERFHARLWELAETDPQIKAMVPKKEVREAILKPGLSYADIIATLLLRYAERPALAERTYEVRIDAATGRKARHYLPSYTTISYADLRGRSEALASAWQHQAKHRVAVDDFVCILGSTGIDFATFELAGAYAHAVTVPLQSSLAGAELDRILGDTAPVTLVATLKDLELAAKLAIANGGIRSVVAIEYDPRVDDERAKFEAARAEIERAGAKIGLTTIDDLIAFGRGHAWEPLAPHPKGLERPSSIMHSSGSTGTPKGAIIPERMARHAWIGGLEQAQVPTVAIAYAPMNHFMGRYAVFGALTAGGTAYFTMKPDLSTLFEDIRLARPTVVNFFPRVFELVYQHYQSELVRRTSAESADPEAVDNRIRMEMRSSFLGDRLRGGTFGSAPTSPEVKTFMRDCFDIMLVEGYGSTEGGILITIEGRVMRPPVIDYKLRDVPELGYYSTDKPYPRGELCVKSELAIPGYFKRPEADALIFDADDGYVCTGDIMEERGLDHIVYIDRRNDVLKLSQAEFVAVGPLGATFEGGSTVIKQIYVYGNSARAYLLAVVVPDIDVATTMIGHAPSEAELKALIRSEMQQVARTARLRTFEVPRDFIIEMEPFSLENGLLSSVRKRMRPNFKRKYGERLEEIYAQIERRRHEELMALKDPNSSLTVLEKVLKALEASLGLDDINPETTLTFAELGGDSLGTVSFSMFLEDIFGVELPVNAIISPAGHPRRWAQMIEAKLGAGDHSVPSCASIHGENARVLHARDLRIERFLDRKTLDNAPTAPPTETRTVLLTGANGFLGRFLCLDWMERLSSVGGKVICLIRAGSDDAARRRLDEVFSGIDPELEGHYRTLAQAHLDVIAGDVAEPSLGLAQKTWERLAGEVDQIVHPGALVNHVLAYEHLFGPNVFGTAELIRLALTQRMKRFDFVSSMAVAYRVETSKRNDEDSPLLETLTLGDSYADGYGVSKWADEVLLHDAHKRFGLPVNIFRGDMMMPHRQYKGQINVPDMFTRMLYSIVMTELAPLSFYEPGPDGKRARARYDGLPVDFLAGAMVGICAQPPRGICTYNTINHHVDDGVSLDTVVDWIESAGYGVTRVRDHGEWMKRFEAKLNALTEAQRQHSSVAILNQFKRPFPASEAPIGSDHFVAAVSKLAIGPDVPHLDEVYIHKYLDDMRRLGLLSAPRHKTAGAVA